eukprot:GHVL01006699.1.p1 GENE.GHVL01006699.1~~GHVL01006699.1.p1  ORF type:complete len:183 (-),score=44.73 GHVL01006699.1:546-1094(-)
MSKKQQAPAPSAQPPQKSQVKAPDKELELKLVALNNELKLKEIAFQKVKDEEKRMREDLDTMIEKYEEEVANNVAISSELTRSYKSTQLDLIDELNSLESALMNKQEQLEFSKSKLIYLKNEKDNSLQSRDKVIDTIKRETTSMSFKFQEMMSFLLEDLKKNIPSVLSEAANHFKSSWQSDQ